MGSIDGPRVLAQIWAMRYLRFLPFLLFLPAAAVPLTAQPPTSGGNIATYDPNLAQKERARELGALFAQLRYSETDQDAAKTEAEIYIRLTQSESPSVNLLLETATLALSNEDSETARAILKNVVTLEPTFAEGLTRAAALAYQDGELEEAERLLNQALKLEPRHFGAWSGLGLVLEDKGDLKGAQKAYDEALYLHPFLDSAKRGHMRLKAKTDGLSL
jgi:Flp pilus assembly protein TadD